MYRARRSLVLFILALAAVVMLYGGPASAKTLNYTLDNGLEVLLLENHRSKVVSMLVWVKTGSGSERKGEYGLAHLMEHMMFKGTHDRAPGEIAREVESSGGEINAYTSFDQTVYYINMASRFYTRGLDILADMVFHSSFDPKEFSREKEVVLEEIRRGEDMPSQQLSKALFESAYRVHPYGRPIIGFEDSVRDVSRETALAFHDRNYRPSNMLLVVSGDFDPNETKALIEKTFGREEKRPAPENTRPVEPPQEAPRARIVRRDLTTAELRIAFRIPGYNDPDTLPVDLAAEILGSGRTSRLYREVRRNQELVTGVSASSYTPADPGLFVIGAQLSPDKAIPALKAIMAEIVKLRQEGPTADEMDRTKLNYQSYFIRSRETMAGEARVAANFEILGGDFREKDRYLARVDQARPEDIRRVAQKYFRTDNMTIALLLPENEAKDVNEDALIKAALEADPPAAPGPAADAGEKAPEEVLRDYTLTNGARLLVKEDASLPLISVRAAFLGGLRYEPEGKEGLGQYVAEVWDRGAEGLPADELDRRVEDMAASISSFSGRNSFGLEAEFLNRFIDPGLDLFTRVLTKPAFAPEEVERSRPAMLDAIRRQEDQPAAQAFRLFSEKVYQPNPYARPMIGTEASISAIQAGDLRAYYENYARPEGLVIAVVGDVDADRIKEKFETLFKDWKGDPSQAPDVPAPEKWTGVKKGHVEMDRSQTHLVLGFPAPGMLGPDRFALDVLDRVLSGQGGRLFIELRDKQSLAYSLSSFYSAGLDAGSFGFYIAFDPAKKEQALKGIESIIAGLKEKTVSQEELDGAKENILGSYEIGLQQYGAQASEAAYNALYGLGLDYTEQYLKGVQAVTAEDVQRVAVKYLDMNQAVLVTAGPGQEE